MHHDEGMKESLKEAQKAFDLGEIPIGAVIVKGEEVIARSFNQREKTKNPLDHAELRLLKEVSTKQDDWRLSEMTIYVTVEPCPMCLGALLQARVGTLVYGCSDPKRPGLEDMKIKNDHEVFSFPQLSSIHEIEGNNHRLTVVSGILEDDCQKILQDFFRNCRETGKRISKSGSVCS